MVTLAYIFYNDYKKISRQGKYNEAHKDKQPVMLKTFFNYSFFFSKHCFKKAIKICNRFLPRQQLI